MVMCWAPDCKHYSEKRTSKFFTFPKDKKLRKKWEKLVRGNKQPGPSAYICSCHFPEGSRKNMPTLFEHNVKKRLTFSSLEKRTRNVAVATVTSEIVEEEIQIQESEVLQSQPSMPSDTRGLRTIVSVALMESENYFLWQQLNEQRTMVNGVQFSYKLKIMRLCKLYTGLSTAKIFVSLYSLL